LHKLAEANFTGHEAILNFLKDGGVFAVLGFHDRYYARGINQIAGPRVVQKAVDFAKTKGKRIDIRIKEYPGSDTTPTTSYSST
jgi:hypothetical protein